MPPPRDVPIGLFLTQSARSISRAFDDAMAAAGGSAATWVILIALKTQTLGNQRSLAAAVGIQQATLTHHLNAMETRGLITRRRDAANRRIQHVELTEQGEAAFLRLRGVAFAFDSQLRTGVSESEIAVLRATLQRMAANVGLTGPGLLSPQS